MYTINRAIAIIKPKQAYFDWAMGLPDPHKNFTLESMREDATRLSHFFPIPRDFVIAVRYNRLQWRP